MDKRSIPRHVDGRIKVGPMTIPNFFKFLPILIIGFILILNNFSPFTLFFGIISLGIIAMLFSEFNNRETGLDVIKDIIRYELEGDIHYERGCNLDNVNKIIFNKIEKNEK